MTRRLKIVIPLIAMLLLLGYLVMRSTLVTNRLKLIVVSKLSERLLETGLLEDVAIGRVSIRAPATVELGDLRLVDMRGMEIFVAKEVSISYNLWEIIRNRARVLESIEHISIEQGQLRLPLRGFPKGLSFNQVEGRVKVDQDALVLEGLRGFMGNIQIRAKGKIGTGEKPMVDLELVSDNLSLEHLGEVIPRLAGARIKGLARLKVGIRGSLDAPEVTGQINLVRGEVAQSQILALEAAFKYQEGVFELTGLRAKLWGGELQGRGRVEFAVPSIRVGQEQIDLVLSLDEANFSEALPRSGLTGSFRLKGYVQGNLRHPKALCQFQAFPKIFGRELTPISGEVQLYDHRLKVSAASEDTGLRVDASGTILRDVLWVDEFWMRQGEGYLTARGKVGLRPEGSVDLFVEARDIALQALPFTSFRIPRRSEVSRANGEGPFTGRDLRGRLNLELHWEGTRRSPKISARLTAEDLSVGWCGFGGLSTEIKYSQRMLEFLPVTSEGGYQLVGYIDFAKKDIIGFRELRLKRRGRDVLLAQGDIDLRARSMDIDVRVESDLKDMGLSSDVIEHASGPMKLALHLGGPLASPEVRGEILVVEGQVELTGMPQPISGIRMQARVEQNILIIDGLRANLGGGDLDIRGRVKLDQGAEDALNLKLASHGVKLHIPDLMEPGDLAEIDLVLYIIGPLNSPEVKGKVDLIDTTFTLSGGEGPGFFGQNITWDMEVHAGRNVRYCSAQMPYMEIKYLEVKGKLAFKGKGKDIDIIGRLDSSRGEVSYLGTDFQVVEASLSSPEFEKKLTVYSRARTTLNGTTVFLVYHGFTETYPGGTRRGDVQLYSNPIMTSQEITALLIRGRSAIVLAQGFGLTNQKVRANLRGLLALDGLLEAKGKEVLGLDVLEIRPDIWGNLRINVGEYIDSDRDWYIAYTRRMPLASQDQLAPPEEWKLEYRIDQDEILKLRKTTEEDFIGLEHLIRF